MGSQPSVSVVIAAKDAADTIAAAIRSALAQPETAEVIVVDDGSADRTVAAARSCEDGTGRLRVICLPENRGPSAARNAALDVATADWWCVLDADDVMLPGRLGKLLAAAAGGHEIVADNLLITRDPSGAGPYRSLDVRGGDGEQDISLATFVASNIPDPKRPRSELGYLKPLIRRDFLDRHGLRYDTSVRLGEDYLLYATALAHGGRLRLLPPCGYVAINRADSPRNRHGAPELRALLSGTERLATLPGLDVAERRLLRRHGASVRAEYCFREVLQSKREGRFLRALRHLLHSPRVTAYILRETLRARLARARGLLPSGA